MNTVLNAKYPQAQRVIADARKPQFQQIDVRFDRETRSAWTYLDPAGSSCFNLALLNELRARDNSFEANKGNIYWEGEVFPVDFAVLASRSQVFSWGGDLRLFQLLIRSRDRATLTTYARACIDCIYARLRHYHSETTTISVVHGDALGGGFEYALSSDIIIAEENARLGFPEILFNLFPGMGAYSLLARKMGARKAEELLLSGKIYSATELRDLGVIDTVVPSGEGERAAYHFMRTNRKQLNGMRAIHRCREFTNPITRGELTSIVDMWVDAAFRLEERDLKMMGRLVRAQANAHEAERVSSSMPRKKPVASKENPSQKPTRASAGSRLKASSPRSDVMSLVCNT